MAEHYRLTIPGGIVIEHGPIQKIALAVLAQPTERAVFVREVARPERVLELTTPAFSPVFTEHGATAPLPTWASTLISTIHSHYGGTTP
jgi:hypothetical protein